jgi:hypothetical protein
MCQHIHELGKIYCTLIKNGQGLFLQKSCVKGDCWFLEPVDWSGRRLTPAGRTTEEAHGRARGKHSAWSVNQQPNLTLPTKKEMGE